MNASRALVDELFRRESARLVALLARRAGAACLDQVEDAVQDALLAALRRWPYHGVPDQPSAWLYTAARNALIDRQRQSGGEVAGDVAAIEETSPASDAGAGTVFERAFDDDLLRLMLFCCHPCLSAELALTLTLKLAAGLSVDEIAAALLLPRESIAQRIVRAKRKLRDGGVDLALPAPAVLREQRLPVLLNALYLGFNAGYLSLVDANAHQADLCVDALRLAHGLCELPDTATPAAQALAALLHLLAARLPARRDASGGLLRLQHQDRGLWNRALIVEGFRYFALSCRGSVLTRFHIEAAIAACHTRAPNFAATDWQEILHHYDDLVRLHPSPVARLNRLIALRYAHGPAIALAELERSEDLEILDGTLLLHATRAEFLDALGEGSRAAIERNAAIALAKSDSVRELLRRSG